MKTPCRDDRRKPAPGRRTVKPSPHWRWACIMFWVLAECSLSHAGEEFHITGSFVNPSPMVFDGFGMALAANASVVVIGAPHAESHGVETGEAYVYNLQTHRLRITLRPPHPKGGELFGWAVAFLGSDYVVGAPRGSDREGRSTGAVYRFHGETGALLMTLTSPTPTAGTFGHAVAVRGDHLVVGDPQASTATTFYTGAAFVFDGRTGTLLHTFYPPRPIRRSQGRFGHAVALVGKYVAVSAPLASSALADGGSDREHTGAVYLFHEKTGVLHRVLQAPTPAAYDYFGWALAGQGDFLLVGALGQVGKPPESGAAYLFNVETGQLIHSLYPDGLQQGDHFGEAVAWAGRWWLIGAPGDDTAGIDAGAVYLFDGTAGTLLSKIVNPSPAEGAADLFGAILEAYDQHFFVGAPFDEHDSIPDTGIVYQLGRREPSF
ncbi:MAG: hypothetical protein D6704_11500 [Nitrospirae bacterium]|nr:MAG: hypothetical protein D6704_11500 [Nitrospirota bacterium]